MIWGEETPGDPARFEAKELPDARYADPEHTAVLGVGAAAPPVDPRPESAGTAPVAGDAGQSAWRRRLAPHHREAVRAWFGRDAR
jgi:hypothetical protein